MKIKHRGPDKTIFIEYDNVKFGFHRLSIMDTNSKGDQHYSINTIINNKLELKKLIINKIFSDCICITTKNCVF